MTCEFEEWLNEESPKCRVQIARRIYKIKEEGYFGDQKLVRKQIWELRWDNGRRLYYSLIPMHQMIVANKRK